LPSATPTSTAPPSRARRNKRWIVAQVVLTAVVFWFVARALVAQWRAFRGVPLVVDPNWVYIIASGALFWATYAILIETLRRLLIAWDGGGARLSFMTVARFWAISNFGRYLPGKVWGIGAMAAMAQQAGVGGVAAAGSAVLNTIVNIVTGAVVALVAGWSSFDRISQGRTALGIVVVAMAIAGLFALPLALPVMLSIARRVTGRSLEISSIPRRAFYIALVGNVLSWVMYGLAFQVFVRGVLGTAPGTLANYITAYAWPYVLGYLAILAPGGLGVREVALAQTLTALSIATPPQALLISAMSRLWLTVLELLPGLLFLAIGARPRSQALH
jgi:hypothetical protein